MITAIIVILVISFLVFVHELGHFLAARAVGVRVIEFSIGFPPKVFSKIVGQTEYIISLIPIGGYVRLHGQNIDDEDPSETDNYAAKSISQRLAILLAGPLMNLVIAFVFMPLVYLIGYNIPAYLMDPPVIDSVIPDSYAERMDIKAGDMIMFVNNQPVTTWRDVHEVMGEDQTQQIRLKIKRGPELVTRIFSPDILTGGHGFGWRIKTEAIIGDIAPQSPANASDLQVGDRILKIGEKSISKWSDISAVVQESAGSELLIEVLRNGQTVPIQLTPKWNETSKHWLIGISGPTVRVSEPFSKAVVSGTRHVVNLFIRTMEFLYQLASFKADTDSVGGPIMIAQMVGKAAKTDLGNLISLVAFISLQFAIFNLLPIPALDGGHIFFLGIEKLKGKSLSKNFRISSQKIGFTLLLSLILLISIQDSLRIFGN